MATIRLLLDYEFLRNETDPNDDRISDNYYTVREWVFDDATKLAYQLPERSEGYDVYGPTPNGNPYSRPTDEEFYDDCDGTTYRGYYHDGAGSFTITPQPESVACGFVTTEPNPTDPQPGISGCTDPRASNYNAAATSDNGSCMYAPPVLTPVFRVPLLNAIRFVQAQVADTCTTHEEVDNVLFCQQSRPGQQLRPGYRQKVQTCDTTTIQVLTNAPAGFAASIVSQPSGEVVRTVDATRQQRFTGLSEPLSVVLSENPDGFTLLSAATAAGLPGSLRRADRLTLAGAATGTYRVVDTPIVAARPALVMNRPWQAVAGAVTASWQLSTVDFDVWEVALDWQQVPPGNYLVRLQATAVDGAAVEAISEPVWLAERHDGTVLLEYTNTDNALGLVWSTGFTGRVRVLGRFFNRRPAGSSTLHRSSSNQPTLLASTVTRQLVLETLLLPDWLHELLFSFCRLDSVRVNGQPCLAPDSYDWQSGDRYPLSNGSVTLELLSGLGTGNGHDLGALPALADDLLILNGNRYLRLH